MRFLSLALLGLMFAAAPMLGAQAADRPTGGRHGTQAAAKQRPASAARSQVAVQRSAPMRGQLGVTRDQRAASSAGGCSPRRGASQCRTARMNWTQGLPPAAGIQANECPDGTMATLAHGHDDIVRCMPI
jgi:hypothetical protein